MDLLAGLNPDQALAVTHEGSPLAVLAGPGSGKTRVITHRLAHMLVHRAIAPEKIVALTFTIKAAAEMRTRLTAMLKPLGRETAAKAAAVTISTYHSLGRRLIVRFADRLGLPSETRMVDRGDLRRLARELIIQQGLMGDLRAGGADAAAQLAIDLSVELADSGVTVPDVATYIQAQQATLASATDAAAVGARASLHRLGQIARTVEVLKAEQRRRGWISFDDLITWPIELLRHDAVARDMIRGDMRHAVVDEFQDVNASTIMLLAELFPGRASPGPQGTPLSPDLCVVGDDDQAIYGFRGSDERAFARFSALWPASTRVMLQDNYRSSPQIVAAAQRIISLADQRAAPDKVLRAAPSARPGEVQALLIDEDAEGPEAIAAAILARRADDLRLDGESRWNRYAVLARTRAELDRLQDALTLEGIPVQRTRRVGVLDDDGVQDLIALLRVLVDGKDFASARRLLLRAPIGLSTGELRIVEQAYAEHRRQSLSVEDQDDSSAPARRVPDVQPYATFLRTVALGRGGAGSNGEQTGDPRLARLADLIDGFAQRAATGRADELLYDLAVRSGVIHADLLAPADRAQRVKAVVALIDFARQHQPTLPKPAGAAEFLELIDDLDRDEDIEVSPADRVEGTERGDVAAGSAAELANADGVHLMTAHASKGLEFDTVFVARVAPQHGFPKTSGASRDDALLPAALLHLPTAGGADRDDDAAPSAPARDAKSIRLDEERRVFYVAATRAERRLILVGRLGPKKTDATYYLRELIDSQGAGSSGGEITSISAAELIARTPSRVSELRRQLQDVKQRRDRAERADELAAAARAEAARALAEVEQPSITAAQLQHARTRLDASLQQLALIAVLRGGDHGQGPAPAWADAAQFADIRQRLGPIDITGAGKPAGVTNLGLRLSAPLKLSYSQLKDYERCPACFYVRHVLGLVEPQGRRQIVGQAVHEALEKYARLCAEADAEGRPRPSLAALQRLGRDIALAAVARSGSVGTASNLASEADDLVTISAQLASAHRMMDHEANIELIEHSARLIFTAPASEPAPDGGEHEHTISLRIDRVERRADGRVAIIDYKTGHATKSLTEPPKTDLQLGLYAMAIMQHYGLDGLGAPPKHNPGQLTLLGHAAYHLLASGQVGMLDFARIDLAKLRASVDKLIAGILAGEYPSKCERPGPCAVLKHHHAEPAGSPPPAD
jgi:superfamily I DNA/RNA helicase/RecB family exonuclease